MQHNKTLNEILKMELTPEGKVLLLGILSENMEEFNIASIGFECGLIPAEVHLGEIDLKNRRFLVKGDAAGTYRMKEGVFKDGTSSNVDGVGVKRTKRPAANRKKGGAKNKK